jgi:hypothetical protein
MMLSRRDFLLTASVAGGALVFLPALTLKNPPVVSFHLDQPYVDITGVAEPYRPPAGARGGAPLAGLSDEGFSLYYGLT